MWVPGGGVDQVSNVLLENSCYRIILSRRRRVKFRHNFGLFIQFLMLKAKYRNMYYKESPALTYISSEGARNLGHVVNSAFLTTLIRQILSLYKISYGTKKNNHFNPVNHTMR